MSQLQKIDQPPRDLVVAVGAATDVGGRATNEDTIAAVELAESPPAPGGPPAPTYLLAVADGMGGHADGEVASRLAIDTLRAAVGNEPGADAGLLFKQAFRRANETIYAQGAATGGERPMGTTLVAALLRGQYATVANVGDSRAYLLRAKGLTQITRDHTFVADEVARGALTPEQARRSPQRNVLTQALGSGPKLDAKLPAIYELTLLPDDRLLLCSDGFVDVLENADLIAAMLGRDAPAAARLLVDLARERGAADNVSAVVAEAVPTRVSVVSAAAAAPPRGRLSTPVIVLIAAIVVIVLVAAVYLLSANFF
ncbi:MAG TPA: protein phosphatase 2C domain-containing protein [Thermomicrobiales bacterium]|nr:protein phosphatase 2C domain-containing protein [Thermomicrobiales bacterium]